MASEPLTLAELARVAGMSVDDVGRYQKQGLVPAPRRSPRKGKELGYHQEHVDRLRFIGRALTYGFSLQAIAQLLDTTSLRTCPDVYRIAATELRRLRDLVGATAPTVSVLKELMDSCDRKGSMKDCKIYRTFAGQAADP